MPQITIEVSDELHQQLAQVGENPADWLSQRLPELLTLSLEQPKQEQPGLPAQVYRYVLDFLASNPTPQQIADFKSTPQMQERLRTLLARSKAGGATPAEEAELDEYEKIEHLMILIKAGNLSYLQHTS